MTGTAPTPVGPSDGARHVSPHPLAQYLPGVMQADDMTSRWTAGLDDLMVPLLWLLDAVDSYTDPRMAPSHMLPWLAGWVGADIPQDLPVAQQRGLLGSTADLHGRRGTLTALREVLELASTAEVVSVEDDGGATWSRDPEARIPGSTAGQVRVRVVAAPAERQRVRDLVAGWCPAHVSHSVEFIAP